MGSTANAEGAFGFGTEVVAGIFLDDFASGVVVRNNMVYGAPIGVQLHNGFSNFFGRDGTRDQEVFACAIFAEQHPGSHTLRTQTRNLDALIAICD